jgi:hypothetical protein
MLRPMLERLQRLDRRLLRRMRTRYHAPEAEDAVKALGRAGEWGALWVAIGLGAATVDATRRHRWLRAAAVAPAAVGFNYMVKLAVRGCAACRRWPPLPASSRSPRPTQPRRWRQQPRWGASLQAHGPRSTASPPRSA